MNAVNKLLDKAKETCSMSSDAALAERMEVSRQQLSRWRKGHDPMPEEQIARLARIAQADAGDWLVLIEAEQARGEARKAYGTLVKRLGIAALLSMAAMPVWAGNNAQHVGSMALDSATSFMVALSIMRNIRRYSRRLSRYMGLLRPKSGWICRLTAQACPSLSISATRTPSHTSSRPPARVPPR